jgi:hypothetical protein
MANQAVRRATLRKVINGKTYRSHTAHLIVTLPSPFPKTDNKWHETRLYRTHRGAYFLAGEGGSGSRWAKITPRGAIPGEGIEPISKDKARAYAKYAGLSPDRFVRAGFSRDEDHWLMEGQEFHAHRVIGRTI